MVDREDPKLIGEKDEYFQSRQTEKHKRIKHRDKEELGIAVLYGSYLIKRHLCENARHSLKFQPHVDDAL